MTKYLVCGYNKRTVDEWGAKVKILAILDSIDEVENFEEILGQTRIENKTKFGEKWVTWVFKVYVLLRTLFIFKFFFLSRA